ncbi:dienelactone hydrolase family protein [Luteimonas gilva]|uniref:Dienelactone hydrolase family protein n=1 Tax=Luteimonas gilva TaxID=2572684 RepID=A0A4U5JUQ3_9GAMM|nr:dienelactone hydrolase family protein [Luteimonas gilva]TKR33604.1 dienelactone hydrolase family protein [Luteimonas gilva]
MGHGIVLDTAHGDIGAWRADPQGAARGALVVIQEIFGVNAHMRSVVDRFAAAGYVALAPAFFDPIEAGVELDYGQEGFAKGRELVNALGLDRAVDIVAAAAQSLKREGRPVSAVGYCWGGTVAYLANTRLGLPAVSYYGARTAALLDETLRAPMMFHFGEKDGAIPAEDIAKHREKQPDAAVYVYAGAGHAFNRDVDTHAYHAESAALAQERTLAFFAEHLS